jgi:iron(III) transport system ATP-binding protein
MPELVVEDVHKRLGSNDILKGVSLAIEKGEVVALLGRSGSGKTTLLRSVAGLETPDAGHISLGGRVLFDAKKRVDVPAEGRGLALVFQSYALWPHRTVADNVAYGLKLRKVPAAEIGARVKDVLGQLGLDHLGDRYPHQLSGGQQQRVALARALVYSPPLILLDEPLSNLDAKLRQEARIWFRQLIQRLHLSALYVTHDQVEAMAVADRVLIIEDGRVEQEGTPQELYENPRSAFAADFMGVNNRFEGRVLAAAGGGEDAAVEIAGDGWSLTGTHRGDRPLSPGDKAAALIRVERVAVTGEAEPDTLPMRLETSLYLGERWEHQFRRGDLAVRLWTPWPLQPGDYAVQFPRESLWVF